MVRSPSPLDSRLRPEGHSAGRVDIVGLRGSGKDGGQKLRVARAIDDRHGVGNALSALGVSLAIEGRTEEALRYYEEALALCRETGARRDEAVALGNLASLQADRGRLEEADALYEQALALHRENGNRRSAAITRGDRAVLEGGADGRTRPGVSWTPLWRS